MPKRRVLIQRFLYQLSGSIKYLVFTPPQNYLKAATLTKQQKSKSEMAISIPVSTLKLYEYVQCLVKLLIRLFVDFCLINILCLLLTDPESLKLFEVGLAHQIRLKLDSEVLNQFDGVLIFP